MQYKVEYKYVQETDRARKGIEMIVTSCDEIK